MNLLTCILDTPHKADTLATHPSLDKSIPLDINIFFLSFIRFLLSISAFLFLDSVCDLTFSFLIAFNIFFSYQTVK